MPETAVLDPRPTATDAVDPQPTTPAVLDPRDGASTTPTDVVVSFPPAARRVELVVDRTDPCFFDHPLDHVPGMLLVREMLDVAAVRPEGRIRTAMTFRRICELDPPPVLALDAAGEVRVSQDGVTVADGRVVAVPGDPVPAPGATARRPRPADAALVHRTRPENILIAEPAPAGERVTAAVLPPPDGHVLAGPHPGVHPVAALIEAGRQLSTLLSHRCAGWPLDAQMLWIGVTAELPVALPADLPLALRWAPAPLPVHKAKFAFELVAADGDGPALGTLTFASKGLTPSQYLRFRGCTVDGGAGR